MFILILLSTFWILYKGFHFLALFESKDYRFDRFQSSIYDRGFISQFYSYKISWPSRSPRNFMIISFHLLVTGGLFLYAFENIYIYNFLSYFFWLAPFVAFVIILTAVALTQIPVQIYRWGIVQTARLKIRNSKAIFIGVTGSYGKTSIAQHLHAIFAKKYAVTMTDARHTNDIGIAQAILRNLFDDTEIFIIEIGSYKKGEIKHAAHYIPLSYLIVTGIGNHRIDLFGSKENMYAEFTSLIPEIPSGKTVYLSSNVQPVKDASANIVTFGFSEHDNVHPTHYRFNQAYTEARIHYKKHAWNITTSLLGKHSLLNLLPVFALCVDIGMKPSDVQHEIKELKHEKGKFSIHRGMHKSVIIVDTQSSNRDGFLLKVDFLKNFSHRTKIIISNGIQELGVEKRSTYEQIIHKMNKNNIQLFTTDSFFKTVAKEGKINTFNDVSQLQKELHLSLDKGTVVLVEGQWPPSVIESLIVHK